MLVALMRAMRPKMLDSFKGSDAQKEFLAKLKAKKTILVVLENDKNIIQDTKYKNINSLINEKKIVTVYGYKPV